MPIRVEGRKDRTDNLDRIAPTIEHRKTAINGLAPSGGFSSRCSRMLNDIADIVKPPLTAS